MAQSPLLPMPLEIGRGIKTYRLHTSDDSDSEGTNSEKLGLLGDLFDWLPMNQALVFVNSTERAVQLVDHLAALCFPTVGVHAGMTPIEIANNTLKVVNEGRCRILVAVPDVLSGLSALPFATIERINIVINCDFPKGDYLAQVGRPHSRWSWGEGLVLNLLANPDEERKLADIGEQLSVDIDPLPTSEADLGFSS